MIKRKRTRVTTADVGQQHHFAVTLMEHLVVPTFVLDARGRVIIWNKACERLTDVPASEVLGTREHWRAFYSERRPCLSDLVVEGRTDEMPSLYLHSEHRGEHGGVHAENWCVMPRLGTRLYLAIDAGPVYDENGALIAVVDSIRDMTAQHEAQLALERLASIDALTGVGNRRTFDSALEREWRRAQRAGEPVSVIMIDVDYFKAYNDRYGHQGGDNCLRTVAASVQAQMLRAGDHVARYGGEEFAAILPGTQAPGAAAVAERIREAIESLRIAHAGAPKRGIVTVSIGVACFAANPRISGQHLVAAADKALYQAKAAGRNRVAVWREPAAKARRAAGGVVS